MDPSFAPFAEDVLGIAHATVWCTVTTVDGEGRPRSRILHPIWEVIEDRPVVWVMTGRTPVKTSHLAANPHVAVSYWSPSQDTVIADCLAAWVDDPAEKRRVWDLFGSTPEPLGYDPSFGGMVDGPDNPLFTPLRLDPYRVQVLRFAGWDKLAGRTWRT
jgi:uncharacterized pyridoxamine 5'-phosphate oxidase family protein